MYKRDVPQGEVIRKIHLSTYATCTDELTRGTLVISTDGAESFRALEDSEDGANGILMEDVKDGKASVLVCGEVTSKHLIGLNALRKISLFDNKILVKG